MARRIARHRWWIALVVLSVLGIVAALLALWGNRDTTPERPLQHVVLTPEQLERGRYLAHAGDCAACHQTEDSLPFAGGFPIKTPFGTIYGTNITPHPDQGIGRWSADEFYRALTRGQAPGGRNLYPAMPYVSYHAMAREDADLIYGYLLQRRPSGQENRPPDVPFPFNLRVLLSGWNLLFFDTEPLPVVSSGASADWQRGRYLANVMGHCGECHTPRGLFGQLERERWYGGYAVNRYFAPDLTPAGLAGRGWAVHDIVSFLRDGVSERGSAYDEMAPVVRHSSRYLSNADLNAVATYLLGDQAPGAQPPPQPLSAAATLEAGRRGYQAWCAGCHGSEGLGLPQTVPALAGNSTVRSSDARNLLLVMIDGLPPKQIDRHSAMAGMPSYAELPDEELAAIANYARVQWGGQPGDLRAAQVAELRPRQPPHDAGAPTHSDSSSDSGS